MSCTHEILQLEPSPFAELASYSQPPFKTRVAAETKSGRAPKAPLSTLEENRPVTTFPAPLVLPHDDLNYDPECPPQSVRSWAQEKERNRLNVDDGRDTIYIAHVPMIDEKVAFVRDWIVPTNMNENQDSNTAGPDIPSLVAYLSAFYHSMPVKLLPGNLSWTPWPSSTSSSSKKQPTRRANLPTHIGLTYNNQSTRIRLRRTPDTAFPAQLHLDDILDTAISILPDDAYALCLVIEHDMYESPDDDFCCGRAYGGSRVAVVQSARYNTVLDTEVGIDKDHAWPMSHCKEFVDRLCAVEDVLAKKPTAGQVRGSKAGAMRSAVDRVVEHSISSPEGEVEAVWFSRLARTVSHELGHCFGIAHCTYYACNMQGTAGLKEDVRQPPYLCPVCEAKVGCAIVGESQKGGEAERKMWVKERCEALRAFCGELEEEGKASAMWRGLDGWLEERLKGL